jgi:hypothetical protein
METRRLLWEAGHLARTGDFGGEGIGKIVPVFNEVPCHKDVLGN